MKYLSLLILLPSLIFCDRLYLKSGEEIYGQYIQESGDEIVFQIPSKTWHSSYDKNNVSKITDDLGTIIWSPTISNGAKEYSIKLNLLGMEVNSVGLLISRVEILNNSQKTIKYITIHIKAYNDVGDIMSPEVGVAGGRLTGPLPPNSRKVELVHSSTYYRGHINTIEAGLGKIEYMDGSLVEIPEKDINWSTLNREEYEKRGLNRLLMIWGATMLVCLGILAAI